MTVDGAEVLTATRRRVVRPRQGSRQEADRRVVRSIWISNRQLVVKCIKRKETVERDNTV